MAEVLESNTTVLSAGDWVLPAIAMSGTWTTHKVCDQSALTKVRNDISVEGAATMMINPASALRMLEDYVQLKEGDWVVQNGANSAVGLAAIQIAKVITQFISILVYIRFIKSPMYRTCI